MLIRIDQSQARAAANMPASLYGKETRELIVASFGITVSLALFYLSTLRLRVILKPEEGRVIEPPSVLFVGFPYTKLTQQSVVDVSSLRCGEFGNGLEY